MRQRRRPTSIDETRVGLSFIEVLFALVVARALDPLADYSKIPGVGLSHLAVAFVLTVTSWIGYHNSWNRRRYLTRWCAAIAVVFGAVVWIIDPTNSTTIIVVDCLLIALILGFRFTKEMRFVTPDDAYKVDRSPHTGEGLAEAGSSPA